MSAIYKDQEIVAMLARKIGADPRQAEYEAEKLIALDLSEFSLSFLPSELWQLVGLQHLYLNSNKLSQLPPEIGLLTHVQTLHLQKNQLSSLPMEFWQLSNLKILRLDNNQLGEVPGELGQLSNLQQLSLENNHLNRVPVELSSLHNLQKLNIDANPEILTPPPEIIAQGTTDILAFLRELQKRSVPRYEAKLLVVGEGGTGKSSLLRALRGDAFDPQLVTTHGIEVNHLQLAHHSHEVILNTWDFGGQQIYHATHQFFLTRRSLYLIVWNARLGAEQGRLHYWLETIKALAPDAPVLLVSTHIDERGPDLNYQRYKNAYPQLIGSFSISNSNGAGIAQLQDILAHAALHLPLMGQPWPQKWLDVEKVLLARAEKHISADIYLHCCLTCEVEADMANGTLANYLHDLGKILYFRDDYILSNLIVLQPNWVTRAISRVLDDEQTVNARGILPYTELSRIWTFDEDGQAYEPYLYPVLLRLMERFELTYQIETDIPGEHSTASLLPQLLPHQPPIELPPWPITPPVDQSQVEMIYRLDFVPAGIMSRFIVRTHRYTKNLHWREGVLLEYQNHQARVELNPVPGELKLLVQGPLPQNFFTILMNTIDVILTRFEGLAVRREIPCICHWQRSPQHACFRTYRYEDLIRRMEVGRHTVECPETLVEVSIPTLLYGIHRSTNEQVMLDIQQGQQEIQKGLQELRKLDLILQELDQQSELIARSFARQWNLEMRKMEAECPSTFLLLSGESNVLKPKNWVSRDYRMYVLCQHPLGPHRVGEGYDVRKAREWWATVRPWLNHLITFLKFGVPMGGAIGAVYAATDIKHMQDAINLIEEITKDLPEFAELDTAKSLAQTKSEDQQVISPALRALYNFLKEVDPHQTWGGLSKTITPDGNILWLCDAHRKPYEARPLKLES